MERQKFEDSWKESFEEAEVSPSDGLWTNIELDLEKENGSKMKRRIMFFQLLAAASIAFAMTFAGVGVYFMLQNNDQPQLAADNTAVQSTPNTQAQDQTQKNTTVTPGQTSNVSDNAASDTNTATSTDTQPNALAESRQSGAHTAQQPNAIATPDRGAGSTTGESTHTQAASRIARVEESAAKSSTGRAAGQTTAANQTSADRAAASQTTADGVAANRTGNRTTTNQTADRIASNQTAADHAATGRQATARTPAQTELKTTQLAKNNATETSKRKRATQVTESAASTAASQPGQDGRDANVQVAAAANASDNNIRNSATANSNDKAANNQLAAATGKQAAAQQTVAGASNNNVTATKSPGEATVAASTPDHATTAVTTASGTPTHVATDPAASVAEADLSKTKGTLPVLAHPAEPTLAAAANEPDPVALMLARLNDEEKKYQQEEKESKKKDKGTERLWTSVGFAAGAYNMVTSGNGSSNAPASSFIDQAAFSATSNNALTNSVVHEQSSAPGVAYSVGLNLGTKIAPRWVLQGGVNYLTQSSDYTTSAAVGTADNSFKPASINELDKISSNSAGRQDARVISTAAYRVNSNLQYFSVPLQAGYLVVNRTFGWQLNAGVSTDLFLRNTLTPDGGSFEKTTQTRADDSPYRSYNFSGLLGTEFSYKFGQHYRLALNPGIRYPFNSIYKSDISVSAMPFTFDVGLKFKYIFH
jgi:hypothetical protein